MAQADQTVQNATFPTVRADINNNLAALFTDSSGATAPTVTVAFQDWIDTSGANPLWKKRNAANNAWITIGTIISNTIAFEGTLPSQTSNSGKFLTTDGTSASWAALAQSDIQTFLSSGTWVKPSTGTFALVRVWGGGGSGGRREGAAGGGGGACIEGLYELADMPATCTVTVGAGGAGRASAGPGSVGGASSFSGTGLTTLNAFGGAGGGGSAFTDDIGGGGGGSLASGVDGPSGGAGGSGFSARFVGGQGGDIDTPTLPSTADFGGAGGGGGNNGGTAQAGANAYIGGGGGGGRGSSAGGAGGSSVLGGNGSAGTTGGVDSAAGSVPGGGSGGSNTTTGAGGDGKVEVFVW
jgi:hypothetical protein